MTRPGLVRACVCAAVAFLVSTAVAQTSTSVVPGLISYQGKVTNPNGTLVGASPTPVNRLVIFRIWGHQSNSTVNDLIYSEQQTVTIADGEFSVLIGQGAAVSGTPLGYSEAAKGPPTVTVGSLNVFGGATRYLGVTIDDGSAAADPEISPRQQLVSSAYAFRARYAESLGSNGASVITALDSGNVGIGSSNPGAKLEVAGNVRAGGAGITNPQLQLLANSASTVAASVAYANSATNFSNDSAAGDTVFRTDNGGKLLFQSGVLGSALVIDGSNRVGIGTASPAAPLHVAPKTTAAAGSSMIIGDNIAPSTATGRTKFVVGNTGAISEMMIGQGASNSLLMNWNYNATAASAYGSIGTFGGSNPLVLQPTQGSMVGISNTSPSAMLHIGTGANGGPGGLLINTGWINSSNYAENRPFEVQVRGTSAMVVNTNGNVGIGTSSPDERLKIGNGGLRMDSSGAFAVDSAGVIGGRFYVATNGLVGVGTNNPTKGILHVAGSVGLGSVGYAYFNSFGSVSTNTASISTGIWGDARIGTGVEFIVSSDERIKVVDGRSNGAADLRTLMQLAVTDYHYKDKVAKGDRPQKKLLGQQLERVFPQAVTRTTDVVPDIYQVAKLEEGWIDLATDLKKGERIKLITEGAETICEVAEVEPGRFRVTDTPKGDKVFVYGREVNDFRTVDYDAIAMLNVSATQQIKREKDAEIAALQKRIDELEAKDRARDAKLAAIEKLLSAGQTVMARPTSSATNQAGGQE